MAVAVRSSPARHSAKPTRTTGPKVGRSSAPSRRSLSPAKHLAGVPSKAVPCRANTEGLNDVASEPRSRLALASRAPRRACRRDPGQGPGGQPAAAQQHGAIASVWLFPHDLMNGRFAGTGSVSDLGQGCASATITPSALPLVPGQQRVENSSAPASVSGTTGVLRLRAQSGCAQPPSSGQAQATAYFPHRPHHGRRGRPGRRSVRPAAADQRPARRRRRRCGPPARRSWRGAAGAGRRRIERGLEAQYGLDLRRQRLQTQRVGEAPAQPCGDHPQEALSPQHLRRTGCVPVS